MVPIWVISRENTLDLDLSFKNHPRSKVMSKLESSYTVSYKWFIVTIGIYGPKTELSATKDSPDLDLTFQGHLRSSWMSSAKSSHIHAPHSVHLATRCTWRLFPIRPHVKQIWLKMAKSSLEFPYKVPVWVKRRNRLLYWSSTWSWENHSLNLKISYQPDFEKIAIQVQNQLFSMKKGRQNVKIEKLKNPRKTVGDIHLYNHPVKL